MKSSLELTQITWGGQNHKWLDTLVWHTNKKIGVSWKKKVWELAWLPEGKKAIERRRVFKMK